jgi:DnaJ-class molecular chaperone
MGDSKKSLTCSGCLGVKYIDEDYKACPRCYGSGQVDIDDCVACDGFGYVSKHFDFCEKCHGDGQIEIKGEDDYETAAKVCPVCYGNGIMINFGKSFK